jgi:branched-chain amino acid transport system substrate-binding protein
MRFCVYAALAAGLGLAAGPAVAEITGGVVRIGVLNDQSGPYSDLGGVGSVVAAQMAVEDFDAAAKGLKVEVVSADHLNKPDNGVSIARRWIDVEGVDMIADVPTSSVALAVAGVVKEKNKVVMYSGPATTRLTGDQCTPNTVHWTYDSWAMANGAMSAAVKSGLKTWFFLTVDYAGGYDLEKVGTQFVEAAGGKVLGAVRHPLNTSDFSSFLLQAQASGAQAIALASAGTDTVNAVKQASEFGLVAGGQTLAGMVVFLTEVHSLGLQAAQGLLLTESFYWDLNDDTRAFSKRFAEKHRGDMPTMAQAGVYASVLHYLKAVEALKDDSDGAKVVDKMKEMPTDDPLFGKGHIRVDGRKIHPMYLFQVKKPSESKGPWDLYNLRATIPADQAFRPLAQSDCPLVKKG